VGCRAAHLLRTNTKEKLFFLEKRTKKPFLVCRRATQSKPTSGPNGARGKVFFFFFSRKKPSSHFPRRLAPGRIPLKTPTQQ
jgi:hypothetical protein